MFYLQMLTYVKYFFMPGRYLHIIKLIFLCFINSCKNGMRLDICTKLIWWRCLSILFWHEYIFICKSMLSLLDMHEKDMVLYSSKGWRRRLIIAQLSKVGTLARHGQANVEAKWLHQWLMLMDFYCGFDHKLHWNTYLISPWLHTLVVGSHVYKDASRSYA